MDPMVDADRPRAHGTAVGSAVGRDVGSNTSEVPPVPPRVIHRRRRPWRWVSSIVVLVVAAFLVRSVATNQQLGWSEIPHYLFSKLILRGVWVTIRLAVIAQILATVVGVVLTAMRHSTNPVLRRPADLYVGVLRGVPLLVQILFWYNMALVFPRLGIGVPFTHLTFSGDTNELISPFTAAILALGLHEAAYMAEILRAGLLSVPAGQSDAALSIGMTPATSFRTVVFPQTMRVVVPPAGNLFIGMLKATALVAVIGGNDLLTRAQQIYTANFKVIPLLIVASIWYLALTFVASVLQRIVERRLSRDHLGGERLARRSVFDVRALLSLRRDPRALPTAVAPGAAELLP